MKNKTLLFYINTLRHGGAEKAIIQLAYNFANAGYNSILVTSFIEEGNEYFVPENVTRISIEKEEIKQSRLKRNLSRIKALRKLCKQYKPQALISFMGEPNFRALCATFGLKVKNIVSVRANPSIEYAGKMGKFVGKKMLPKADGCVFQTEDAKSWFPKKLQKKSKVILNPVERRFFETEYVGGNNIVTLGRLDPIKNHKLLIEAFAEIKDEFENVNLEIYGSGDLEKELNELIESKGLNDRASLMGRTDNSAEVLAHSKVFVLSSNSEGMPNALMEALAVGVPCISTDCPCGGPKMLIEEGQNGLLFPVGDKDALANALRKVLSDDDFAKELSKNAKIKSEKFKTENVFGEWKDYIEGIIG